MNREYVPFLNPLRKSQRNDIYNKILPIIRRDFSHVDSYDIDVALRLVVHTLRDDEEKNEGFIVSKEKETEAGEI